MVSPLQKPAVCGNKLSAHGAVAETINVLDAPHPGLRDAPATAEPDLAPNPPILPIKREWRAAVLEAAGAGSAPELTS